MHPPQRPYVRIQASRAFSWTDLRDLWNYREVLLMLAIQDIKLRDKRTALGVVWVVLQPLLAGLIFAVIFGQFIRLSSDGYPYLLFVFSALIGWQLFAGILQRAGAAWSTRPARYPEYTFLGSWCRSCRVL